MNGKTKLGLLASLASTALLTYCLPQAGSIQAMEDTSAYHVVASTKPSAAESSSADETEASTTSDTKESSSITETTTSTSTAAASSTTSGKEITGTSSTSSSDSTSQGTNKTSTSSSAVTLTAKETQHLQEHLPTTVDEEDVEENYQYSVVKNQTTAAFIAAIGEDAQAVAWDNDLYASVMMAQAILETGSGNSALSSAPNYNLFGIKGSYDGDSVTYSTQEDDGSGNLYTIQAKFRKYPSYKESLEDYAALLTEGISGNAGFYSRTWKSNTTTYEDATAFLTGRYATDVYYGQKLNALIEAYDLTQFDGEATDVKTAASPAADSTTASDTGVLQVKTNEQDVLWTVGQARAISTNSESPTARDASAFTQQPAQQIPGNQRVQE